MKTAQSCKKGGGKKLSPEEEAGRRKERKKKGKKKEERKRRNWRFKAEPDRAQRGEIASIEIISRWRAEREADEQEGKRKKSEGIFKSG